TLLDIASLVIGQTKYAGAVKAIKAIVDVIQFVKDIDAFLDSNPASLVIDIGSFTLGGDTRQPGAAKNSTPVTTALAAPVNNQVSSATDRGATEASRVVSRVGTKQGAFRFPLLTNPASAFGLLTGKNVDLFIYDLPALDLEFEYIKSFQIFPGLNA